jgi:hypothetical protein
VPASKIIDSTFSKGRYYGGNDKATLNIYAHTWAAQLCAGTETAILHLRGRPSSSCDVPDEGLRANRSVGRANDEYIQVQSPDASDLTSEVQHTIA